MHFSQNTATTLAFGLRPMLACGQQRITAVKMCENKEACCANLLVVKLKELLCDYLRVHVLTLRLHLAYGPCATLIAATCGYRLGLGLLFRKWYWCWCCSENKAAYGPISATESKRKTSCLCLSFGPKTKPIPTSW